MEEHPLNAYAPMLVTESGITTLSRDVQFRKARSPMFATLAPMVRLLREEHPLNAYSPMLSQTLPSSKSTATILDASSALEE